MMCSESLEGSEQERRKRKTIGQDEEMNDDKEKQEDKMDDKDHIESTVYTGIQLKIPVEELKLGVDDDTSTLATQETSVKNLVYITNIQEERQGIMKDAQNDGKNPSKQDDKKPTVKTSPLEKYLPVKRNDILKDYGESGIDNNPEGIKNKKHKKIIHMEFNTDDDVEEQLKNANDGKAEGKVQVKKKTVHYCEFSSEDKSRKQADPKQKIPKMTTKNQGKMMKMIRLLSPRK